MTPYLVKTKDPNGNTTSDKNLWTPERLAKALGITVGELDARGDAGSGRDLQMADLGYPGWMISWRRKP